MPENSTIPPDASKNKPPTFDWRSFYFTMALFLLYYAVLSVNQQAPENLPYSEFKQRIINEQIHALEMTGFKIKGYYSASGTESAARDHFDFMTLIPSMGDERLLPLLEQQGVEVIVNPEGKPWWLELILGVLPWALIFGFFVYSNRMLQARMGGGNGMFGFSKSRAKLHEHVATDITFDEVAGLESAKQDLREIIDYLKAPEKFRQLGAKLPKGVLMMGPPGTGKTLLAKATASEAGVAFFSISGSEFIEMFVGVGASRVRDMFKEAREKAPALIFIDEIDSVGRVRGTGMGGGNDEREQTLNQILAEMDGFSSDLPVVIIAATNRPDVLDPALTRPGRFDRKIVLELPQHAARVKILKVHTLKKPLAKDVDLEKLASQTVGFSGADLNNLVNEAALHAARLSKSALDSEDFDYAHDKILLGAERSDILNEEDKRRVACHESGHALVALFSEHADPVSKVTIIPHGSALGVTEMLPKEDRYNYTEAYLKDRICVMLGGRCAEKLILGQVSSGASDDLKQATKLARKMVTQFGMSQSMGPVSFPQDEEHPFLGMDIQQAKTFSEHTAQQIDEEIKALVLQCETKAVAILKQNQSGLQRLIDALFEKETLDAESIRRLVGQSGEE